VLFGGKDLTKLSPHEIVRNGVVQMAEGRAILTTPTVRENLDLGAYTRKDKAQVPQDLEWVLALFPALKNEAKLILGVLEGAAFRKTHSLIPGQAF
jgi:branched-chain amino acid transport system ATP-binding protein